MKTNRLRSIGAVAILAALAVAAEPARAAGFAIFEQGTKAMGLGGAFTAQADDPAGLYHNVGGLAFQRGTRAELGTTFVFLGDSKFSGAAPFPGAGATGDQTNSVKALLHAYVAQPISPKWSFGLAVNNPFGLATEWDDPDTWSGRFISEFAELRSFDIAGNFGVLATEDLGIGFGVIWRGSDVVLKRRSAAVNPFNFQVVEVAKVRLESDVDWGLGWNVGILHKACKWFQWGLSYRSKIAVDYSGTARLEQVATGDPVFDAIVAATQPFGQDIPIETRIEFPATASLGAAFTLREDLVLETDVNWAGWNSFDELAITAPTEPGLNATIPENWRSVMSYRAGLRYDLSKTSQLRFGAYYDETPQPTASTSPLLPDASRWGYSFGYGHRWTRVSLDLAVLYVDFLKRTVTDSRDGFYGSYENATWLFGATLGF